MRMVFDLDMEKCVACGACAIACMDQNDIDTAHGQAPFRRVGIMNPLPNQEDRRLTFLSLGCMHCADAPCIKACPVGCLYKNEMNLTVFDNTRCIGCHSCAMACPFGAPTYGEDGKMRKCDGCAERQKYGLIPACVRVCPTGALTCRAEDEYEHATQERSLRRIMETVRK